MIQKKKYRKSSIEPNVVIRIRHEVHKKQTMQEKQGDKTYLHK